MDQKILENEYWNETREYFKQKTIAFKELKKKREIEIMLNELNKVNNLNNNNNK